MKRVVLIFLFIFVRYTLVKSQAQCHYEILFDNIKIKFTDDTIEVGTSMIRPNDKMGAEGVSSLYDNACNLLYYTDGYRLWDGNNSLVDTGFMGISIDTLYYNGYENVNYVGTISQSTIFAKIDSVIYLFTNDFTTSFNKINRGKIRYNKILGGQIVLKNQFIDTTSSEMMNVVRHANGRDYFLYHLKGKQNIENQFLFDSVIVSTRLVTADSIYNLPNQYQLFNEQLMVAGPKILFAPREDTTIMFLESSGCCAFSVPFPIKLFISKLDRKRGVFYDVMRWERLIDFLFYDLLNAKISYLDEKIFYYTYNDSNDIYYLIRQNLHNNSSEVIFATQNGNVILTDQIKCKLFFTVSYQPYTLIHKVFIYDECNGTKESIEFSPPFDTVDGYGLGINSYINNYTPHDLRPEMRAGFEYAYKFDGCNSASNTTYKVTYRDTSSGHFYRLWDFGDGSVSDTLWVTQHAELLGKVDSFQVVSHVYSRPGRYKVKLQILNPYDYGEHLPTGKFLIDSIEQWIVIPDCIYPSASHASEVCYFDTLVVRYTGTENYDTLYYESVPLVVRGGFVGDSAVIRFPSVGDYVLRYTAANATYDTTWESSVRVLDCDELWIPNAFSPNRDGVNDVFSYECRSCVWHRLEIYNRDSQAIYECEGGMPCVWNGVTARGAASEGVYGYRLRVRKMSGVEVERVGTVLLMR